MYIKYLKELVLLCCRYFDSDRIIRLSQMNNTVTCKHFSRNCISKTDLYSFVQ